MGYRSKQQALNAFLESVEKRAFCIARVATRNEHDALDIVQDAMLILVKKYSSKTEKDWLPLFHRILQNCIRDWIRRQQVRSKWLSWSFFTESEPQNVVLDSVDYDTKDPANDCDEKLAIDGVIKALDVLSARQQQVFLLRAWQGLDVRETASAMGCSQSSVKTHYSRAITRLRVLLEDNENE